MCCMQSVLRAAQGTQGIGHMTQDTGHTFDVNVHRALLDLWLIHADDFFACTLHRSHGLCVRVEAGSPSERLQ
jgi:hypothetical protein